MQFCPRYADVFFSLSPDCQSGHIILCSSFFRNFMRIPYKMKIFLAYLKYFLYLCSQIYCI